MPDHDHPYHFEPTYPIQCAIDLAKAVKTGPSDVVTHAKHGAGILGCCLEKHDSEPEPQPFGASAYFDLQELSEDELADRILECCAPQGEGQPAAQADGSILLPILLPLISALLQRLLARLGR